jgi:predicted nucleic acid-binding protein
VDVSPGTDGRVSGTANSIKNSNNQQCRRIYGLDMLTFDDTDADAYRQIVEVVGYSRRKLLGRMIAPQALVRRATLVSLNAGDFRDVPGLELLSW